MMIAVTFDPETHKVMPLSLNEEMLAVCNTLDEELSSDSGEGGFAGYAVSVFNKLIEAAPDAPVQQNWTEEQIGQIRKDAEMLSKKIIPNPDFADVPQGEQTKEIERLTKHLAQANAGFEEFERKLYLAQDEIERLTELCAAKEAVGIRQEQRIMELEAVPQGEKCPSWTSVNERLPEADRSELDWLCSAFVLAYFKNGQAMVCTYERFDSDSEWEWKTSCSECWTVTNQVTHWMPLLAQPKKAT